MERKNVLKEELEKLGLTPTAASKLGVPYHALYKQFRGERRVGYKAAILYEKVLGIPKWVLRPDIWEKPEK